MTRKSRRQKLICAYAHVLDYRLEARRARTLNGIDDEGEADADAALLARVHLLLQTRYSLPRVQVSREPRFAWFMAECSDREFLRSFRMERYSFHKLVLLIQDHAAFQTGDNAKRMASAAAQLLVFLKYVGTFGSDACIENLSQMFEVSSGVCFNSINRISTALMELYNDVVYWPSKDERRATAARIQAGFDFPHCVELVDGTLLPLAFKPTVNGEDYFTRKGGYALNAMMFCDDNARITYALVGWPGSSHDNRVWSNSAVCRKPFEHFDAGQYLLGDSAFSPSPYIVPAFKKLPGASMTSECEYFNKKLAKIAFELNTASV